MRAVYDEKPTDEKILISVVVPVFNEETILVPFLERLEGLQDIEIIVVDGGSEDRTLSLLRDFASRHPIRVEVAPRGRARQMNKGALRASGEILLFLHADSAFPPEGIGAIREAMRSPAVAGGAFRLRIDSPSLFLKGVAWAANARSRYWGLPYGDQGIFVRREIFEKLGGYADLPLMEEVDFIKRLKKIGRIVLLKEAIVTSARRWYREGKIRNTLRNALLLILYAAGVPPVRLARWYHRGKNG